MKNLWIILLSFLVFSCSKPNAVVSPKLTSKDVKGRYELVKIDNRPTCCNAGGSIITKFENTYSITMNDNTITEFEGGIEINKFNYEVKTELIYDKETVILNILNFKPTEKTIFQTLGWFQKFLYTKDGNNLILGVRWGKEGELTNYYFQKKDN